jgi:RNA polymerase subunit RPABC4/transcription elongation factor Spt4
MEYLVIWLICGLIAGVVFQNKGQPGCTGFLIGFLLGPLGIILALVSKPNIVEIERQQIVHGQMKKCPFCKELIRADAQICRYCQRDQPALAPEPPLPQGMAKVLPGPTKGWVCSDCGGYVRENADFCKHCHKPFFRPNAITKN